MNAILSNHLYTANRLLLDRESIDDFYKIFGYPLDLAKQINNTEMVKLLSQNQYIQLLTNASTLYYC
ncbi:MAG: hypothetical protein AB8U25_05715 [Rickettsiales endosymbiont of Dermacentor nuttalli]